MTCEKFRALVSLYIDHELEEAEEKEMEAHVQECRECATYLKQVKYADRLFSSVAEKEAPKQLLEKIKDKIRSL